MNNQTVAIAGSASARVGAEPARISPIDETLAGIRNVQGATHDLLDQLMSRLEPVLQAGPPPGESGSKRQLPTCQLHEELDDRLARAQQIHSRIRELLERVVL